MAGDRIGKPRLNDEREISARERDSRKNQRKKKAGQSQKAVRIKFLCQSFYRSSFMERPKNSKSTRKKMLAQEKMSTLHESNANRVKKWS